MNALGDGIDRLSGSSQGITFGPYEYLIERRDGVRVAGLSSFGFQKLCFLDRLDQMYVRHASIPQHALRCLRPSYCSVRAGESRKKALGNPSRAKESAGGLADVTAVTFQPSRVVRRTTLHSKAIERCDCQGAAILTIHRRVAPKIGVPSCRHN